VIDERRLARLLFCGCKIWLALAAGTALSRLRMAGGWLAFVDPKWIDTGEALLNYWQRGLKMKPKPVIAFDWYRSFVEFGGLPSSTDVACFQQFCLKLHFRIMPFQMKVLVTESAIASVDTISSVKQDPFCRVLPLSLPYLITLSAWANTLGGIVRAICFAVFRLITKSNLVGCSTGRSAGLLPLRILSTTYRHRRLSLQLQNRRGLRLGLEG
jgi:hypothetical protein